MNTKRVILIVSPPGDLQIGLQALLTAHLDVDVLVTGEGDSALKAINRHNPTLVILDHSFPKTTAPMIVHHIKTNWPEILCVVLINDGQEKQKFVELGAELIVTKGLPGPKLIAKIKKILYQE